MLGVASAYSHSTYWQEDHHKFEARLIYLVRSRLGKPTKILFQKAKKKKNSLIENKAL